MIINVFWLYDVIDLTPLSFFKLVKNTFYRRVIQITKQFSELDEYRLEIGKYPIC